MIFSNNKIYKLLFSKNKIYNKFKINFNNSKNNYYNSIFNNNNSCKILINKN